MDAFKPVMYFVVEFQKSNEPSLLKIFLSIQFNINELVRSEMVGMAVKVEIIQRGHQCTL